MHATSWRVYNSWYQKWDQIVSSALARSSGDFGEQPPGQDEVTERDPVVILVNNHQVGWSDRIEASSIMTEETGAVEGAEITKFVKLHLEDRQQHEKELRTGVKTAL